MIISHGRRYLFVHIPKTGGTSLALALEARAKADDILIGDTPKANRRKRRLAGVQTAGRLWKHSTCADVIGLLRPQDLEQLFVFTLVRNPWDRMVSYYHWLQGQSFDHPAVGLAQALAFAPFLQHPQTQASFAAAPYGSYVMGPDGRECCDLFIRLEDFAADAQPLESHLGFKLSLPRANASARVQDYRRYYTDESAQIVQRLCAQDISRFNYRFDDPA